MPHIASAGNNLRTAVIVVTILLAAGGVVLYLDHVRDQDKQEEMHRAATAAEDSQILSIYGELGLRVKRQVEADNALEIAAAKREGRNAYLKDWKSELELLQKQPLPDPQVDIFKPRDQQEKR